MAKDLDEKTIELTSEDYLALMEQLAVLTKAREDAEEIISALVFDGFGTDIYTKAEIWHENFGEIGK